MYFRDPSSEDIKSILQKGMSYVNNIEVAEFDSRKPHDVTIAEVNVKEGEALWSKWLRLKREITGEAIPNWNRIYGCNGPRVSVRRLFLEHWLRDKLLLTSRQNVSNWPYNWKTR